MSYRRAERQVPVFEILAAKEVLLEGNHLQTIRSKSRNIIESGLCRLFIYLSLENYLQDLALKNK
jgi:hypothetical protein